MLTASELELHACYGLERWMIQPSVEDTNACRAHYTWLSPTRVPQERAAAVTKNATPLAHAPAEASDCKSGFSLSLPANFMQLDRSLYL